VAPALKWRQSSASPCSLSAAPCRLLRARHRAKRRERENMRNRTNIRNAEGRKLFTLHTCASKAHVQRAALPLPVTASNYAALGWRSWVATRSGGRHHPRRTAPCKAERLCHTHLRRCRLAQQQHNRTVRAESGTHSPVHMHTLNLARNASKASVQPSACGLVTSKPAAASRSAAAPRCALRNKVFT
jgi:hypothetical protein